MHFLSFLRLQLFCLCQVLGTSHMRFMSCQNQARQPLGMGSLTYFTAHVRSVALPACGTHDLLLSAVCSACNQSLSVYVASLQCQPLRRSSSCKFEGRITGFSRAYQWKAACKFNINSTSQFEGWVLCTVCCSLTVCTHSRCL